MPGAIRVVYLHNLVREHWRLHLGLVPAFPSGTSGHRTFVVIWAESTKIMEPAQANSLILGMVGAIHGEFKSLQAPVTSQHRVIQIAPRGAQFSS